MMKNAIVQTLRIATFGIQKLQLEVCIQPGLPKLHLCTSRKGSIGNLKQRLISALKSTGFSYPKGRIITRLSTLDGQILEDVKWATHFDLPLALAILVADGQVAFHSAHFVVGSFDLQGKLVNDEQSFQMVTWLWEENAPCLLPQSIECSLRNIVQENTPETWWTLDTLADLKTSNITKRTKTNTKSTTPLLKPFRTLQDSNPCRQPQKEAFGAAHLLCMDKQPLGLYALELALCGFHSALFVGSPGCGKTTLARFSAQLSLKQNLREKLNTLRLLSLAGHEKREIDCAKMALIEVHSNENPNDYIWQKRTNSPGILLLAHGGILLLDDFQQFKASGVHLIKSAMNDHYVSFEQEGCWFNKPCEFVLLATMNPCPCGHALSLELPCTCSSFAKDRYWQKMDQALLDRFDLFVPMRELAKADWENYRKSFNQENQVLLKVKIAEVKERLASARKRQKRRYVNRVSVLPYNALVDDSLFSTNLAISSAVYHYASDLCSKLQVSGRRFNRMLRLARTVADFMDEDVVREEHIHQALQFRPVIAPGKS